MHQIMMGILLLLCMNSMQPTSSLIYSLAPLLRPLFLLLLLMLYFSTHATNCLKLIVAEWDLVITTSTAAV